MQKQPFNAQVSLVNGTAVVGLHGEINAFAEGALERAYSEAEEHHSPVILLNFTDVDYINSTGIALIVSLLARARKNHIRLAVYGLTEHYQEIFHITRLSDFMEIYPDEDSAMAEETHAETGGS